MAKRRKISEIYKDMDKINKRKPSDKEIDELAEILNETDEENQEDEEVPYKKIAHSQLEERNLDDNQSCRI